MRTLLKRELTSLALWPATYAIAAAYIAISGVFFIDLVSSNKSADLQAYYANVANLFFVLCPALAARSLADERASGALTITLAWPVSRVSLVLSKFIANTLVTWVILSISWIYYLQLEAIANPDGARALGGWIALLLLSAMFNAIALAISAAVSSAVLAFFLGFGVELFLWIVQYLPENVRGKLDQFAPVEHFNPLLRGVLPFEDVAYFVALALGALGLAVYALSRRRAGNDRQVLIRRVLAVSAATGAFLATPAVAGAASGQIDLTPEQRETVSRATTEVIDKVGDVPIELTAFSQNVSLEASNLRATVRKYKEAGANITERVIDPDISPALALSSGVTDYNTYLLKVAGRTQELDDLIESTVTSGIALLAQTDPPMACFVQGHGERRLTDSQPEGLTSFAARLRIIGYNPGQIFLAGKGAQDLLDQCAVVLVIGPRSTMPAGELATLAAYAKAKGRLIVAADAVRGDVNQLNSLIQPWGLKYFPDPVRDPQSLADDPAAVVSSRFPSASAIVDVLNHDDTPVVFSNSLALNKIPTAAGGDPPVTALVQSSPESYFVGPDGKELPRTKAVYTLAGLADVGELIGEGTGATLTSTRVGVLGSSEVASNQYQKSFGNQEFFIRLLQYVAQDDVIVSAYREVGASSQFTITGDQRTSLIRKAVVTPALAALIFVPFVLFRLKRG